MYIFRIRITFQALNYSYINQETKGFFQHLLFKAAPWDDINFRFYFCKVVYPSDYDFIFLRVFRF